VRSLRWLLILTVVVLVCGAACDHTDGFTFANSTDDFLSIYFEPDQTTPEFSLNPHQTTSVAMAERFWTGRVIGKDAVRKDRI